MMFYPRQIMAARDAPIDYLKYELMERTKENTTMTDGDKTMQAGDDRLRDLEAKMKEMEALMKGLTEELLDLKTIVMKLNIREPERRQPVVQRVPASDTVVRSRSPGSGAPQSPGQRTETVAPGERVMIMQSDGTLKPESRAPEGFIVAGRFAQSGGKGKKGAHGAGDEGSKKEPSDLIFAVDEDTKEKKKK